MALQALKAALPQSGNAPAPLSAMKHSLMKRKGPSPCSSSAGDEPASKRLKEMDPSGKGSTAAAPSQEAAQLSRSAAEPCQQAQVDSEAAELATVLQASLRQVQRRIAGLRRFVHKQAGAVPGSGDSGAAGSATCARVDGAAIEPSRQANAGSGPGDEAASPNKAHLLQPEAPAADSNNTGQAQAEQPEIGAPLCPSEPVDAAQEEKGIEPTGPAAAAALHAASLPQHNTAPALAHTHIQAEASNERRNAAGLLSPEQQDPAQHQQHERVLQQPGKGVQQAAQGMRVSCKQPQDVAPGAGCGCQHGTSSEVIISHHALELHLLPLLPLHSFRLMADIASIRSFLGDQIVSGGLAGW